MESNEGEPWVQPVLEGMSEREILEGFRPEGLLEYRGFLLGKHAELLKSLESVQDVLDGYGIEYGDENITLGEN